MMDFLPIIFLIPFLVAIGLLTQFRASRFRGKLRRKNIKIAEKSKVWLILSIIFGLLFLHEYLNGARNIIFEIILSTIFIFSYYKYLTLNRK